MNYTREITAIIGNTKFSTFDNVEFYIDFYVEKTDKPGNNSCDIVLYNISQSSRDSITKNQTVILNAGYATDIGVIFIGGVESVVTERIQGDKITTVTCIDGKIVNDQRISKTYAPGATTSQIITDLVRVSSLEINRLELVNDIAYPNGKTVYGRLVDELEKLARAAGSKYQIKNNIISISAPTTGTSLVSVVSVSTGLLETPTPAEDTSETSTLYSIRTQLNHHIDVDDLVRINARNLNGQFRVNRVKHTGSLTGEFITEFEVVVNE